MNLCIKNDEVCIIHERSLRTDLRGVNAPAILRRFSLFSLLLFILLLLCVCVCVFSLFFFVLLGAFLREFCRFVLVITM